FFQAEDGIRDATVTGVQTCSLPISSKARANTRFRSPELCSYSSVLFSPAAPLSLQELKSKTGHSVRGTAVFTARRCGISLRLPLAGDAAVPSVFPAACSLTPF